MIEGALRREVRYCLNIPLGFPSLTLDASWLLIAPAILWAVATIYIPTIGAGLSGFQTWTASLAILSCIIGSLLTHALAHAFTARILGYNIPTRIPVHPLGDMAQVWPAAPGAGAEALTSLAGISAQGFLAIVAYLIWNAQFNHLITVISFFLIFFNLGLIALNLTPAFPFDGGRLIRAVFWELLHVPVLITRVASLLGLFIAFVFIGWGSILFFQHTSLSLETSMATLILGAMILFSLALYRGANVIPIEQPTRLEPRLMVLRVSASILAALLLAAITFSLLPMNYGLEAPGFTASVEPMVQLPQEYRHSSKGSFLISSVILQAPILTGEWVYGHLDHSIKLLPQEKVVPVTTTVQAVAQTDYQMLLDSEMTAAIVGLQMAGYPAEVVGNNINMPFPVKIIPQKTDGGPSAGLMFTLGVYDLVSPQDLTGGRKIAGTGTIDLDGRVGPVGGVEQKVVAAEHAGAQYFLTSSWNYQEALACAKHIRVVKVDTIQEAIDFLKGLPPLPE